MKKRPVVYYSLCVVLIGMLSCNKTSSALESLLPKEKDAPKSSDYDKLIMADKPVGYWLLSKDDFTDASGNKLIGSFHGSARGEAKLPNGQTANVFNGTDNYFEIPDNDFLEVTRTGILTIEAWMRPDVENFPVTSAGDDKYIHWMGKGTKSGDAEGNHLWAARMYNKNSVNRPQRVSGYCFNLIGGLGAGSYFQEVIKPGTWVHYVLIINTKNTSSQYPTGYTRIYRDGKLKATNDLEGVYFIVPGNGNAPTRIATRDMNSFFQGAIGKVAIYDYELMPSQLLAHNNEMRVL